MQIGPPYTHNANPQSALPFGRMPFSKSSYEQSSARAQSGKDSDRGKFSSALDFLEESPAYIRFLGQCFLRKRTGRAKTIHLVSKPVADGFSHLPTLAGSVIQWSAL